MVKGAPDYKQIADKVMRPDLYMAAMKELGVKTTATDLAPAYSAITALGTGFALVGRSGDEGTRVLYAFAIGESVRLTESCHEVAPGSEGRVVGYYRNDPPRTLVAFDAGPYAVPDTGLERT